MAERKIWTQEVLLRLIQEDRVLLEIIQVRKIKKWSAIARCMETEYNVYGRTGKQCRERWHNQLDPTINNQEWTRAEEEILFRCHNQNGNKWAKIALQLPGRTDNNIKNHFYSTLRKGLRKLNKVILDIKFKGQFKEFKGNILSKLITVAEDKFERKLNVSDELRNRCVQLKMELTELSKDEVEGTESECVKLAKQIVDFNRSYRKRKSKKRRNESDDEDEDTIGSSDIEKNALGNPHPQATSVVAPAPAANLQPVVHSATKDRKTESRNFLPLVRMDKSNHEEEDAGSLGLPFLRKKSSQMQMRSPLMYGSRRISNLYEPGMDLGQSFPNLENSGNMSAFNNFNFNFLGNSQQLFMPMDMLDEQKVELDETRQAASVKNLF